MRRHKDPTRKTAQAEDNPSPEDPHNPDSRHKHGGAAPVTWRCTRTEEVHCLRIGCSAPTHKNKRGTDTTHPLPAAPLHAQLGPTGGTPPTPPTPPPALQPTPAHSDTSYTLTCEEPDLDPNYTPNYEKPLFGKAVGQSRQRRWWRPTRMMETSSSWDRLPILLRSGSVLGPANAHSRIG